MFFLWNESDSNESCIILVQYLQLCQIYNFAKLMHIDLIHQLVYNILVPDHLYINYGLAKITWTPEIFITFSKNCYSYLHLMYVSNLSGEDHSNCLHINILDIIFCKPEQIASKMPIAFKY